MIEIPDVAGPLEDVDLHAQDFDGQQVHYLDVRGDQYSGPQPLRFHLRLWTPDREALEQLRDALDDYLDGETDRMRRYERASPSPVSTDRPTGGGGPPTWREHAKWASAYLMAARRLADRERHPLGDRFSDMWARLESYLDDYPAE